MENKKRMLLHACCGPCSTSVVERLMGEYDVTIFFFNPNIMPKDEYDKRYNELIRYNKLSGNNLTVINAPYDNDKFKEIVYGLENIKEGGIRCEKCIAYRMEESAKYAKENGYEIFTTTLSVSPHKNAEYINMIGKILEDKYKIKYLESNFKKQNGYLRSIELCKKFSVYRQNYCGCKFD